MNLNSDFVRQMDSINSGPNQSEIHSLINLCFLLRGKDDKLLSRRHHRQAKK
jgi:hypothetical protein